MYNKKKREKIGMGHEPLHIMELLSVLCLQVSEVIPIFSPGVGIVILVGVVLKDSLGGTMM